MALNGAHNLSQLPLYGVVMCCTSIPAEQRTELSTIAAEMGAVSKLDLTADVTHLIVGDADTPKYKYVAKERTDVKVLLPEWIQAVREKWISGSDELDIVALEREYRVPTFFNLRICVTGFEDLSFRKQIEELAVANGATYKGDLTKEITHLMAFSVQSQKYRYAKTWGLKIVTLEWFQQSLERGMILDESLYNPLMEPHERGKGAWTRRAISATNLGKRRRGENSPITAGASHNRRLRRSASSRFDSQNGDFWTDIISAAPAVDTSMTASKWDEIGTVDESMMDMRPPTTTTNIQNPFESAPQMPQQPRGIFADCKFVLYGFDQKQTRVLHKHLLSHNAQILATLTESQDMAVPVGCLVLVPYDLRRDQIPTTLRQDPNSLVTDFWLEKCLFSKTLIKHGLNPSYTPFQFPCKGFESLVISSTAFEDIDLLHVSKITTILGGKYDECLTKMTSILVCNNASMSRNKVKHAVEWQIPAVTSDWLWNSMNSGKVQSLKPYLVYPSAQQHLQLAVAVSKAQIAEDKSLSETKQDNAKRQLQESDKHAAQPRPDEHVNQDSDITTQNAPFFEDDGPEDLPIIEHQANDPELSEVAPHEEKTDERPLKPLPLQERSPNSPTKQKSPKSKLQDEKGIADRQASDRAALSDTLQTILSRQKSSGNTPGLQRSGSSGSARGSSARKEKRLLGRATSNLSARSGNAGIPLGLNLNHSRASSIDTLHTDGLGTPIEAGPSEPLLESSKLSGPNGHSFLTASALTSHDELLAADDDDPEPIEAQLPMTQVGYDDPEAGRWRAKFLRKLTAGRNTEDVAHNDDETHDADDNIAIAEATRGGYLEDESTITGASMLPGRRTRRRRGS